VPSTKVGELRSISAHVLMPSEEHEEDAATITDYSSCGYDRHENSSPIQRTKRNKVSYLNVCVTMRCCATVNVCDVQQVVCDRG
jgi:hypothetical protein